MTDIKKPTGLESTHNGGILGEGVKLQSPEVTRTQIKKIIDAKENPPAETEKKDYTIGF